jgi:hypothetical protein
MRGGRNRRARQTSHIAPTAGTYYFIATRSFLARAMKVASR